MEPQIDVIDDHEEDNQPLVEEDIELAGIRQVGRTASRMPRSYTGRRTAPASQQTAVAVTIDAPPSERSALSSHHVQRTVVQRKGKSVLDFLDPHSGRGAADVRERHLAELLESKLQWNADHDDVIGETKYSGGSLHNISHRQEIQAIPLADGDDTMDQDDEVDLLLTYSDAIRSMFDSHSVLLDLDLLDMKDIIRHAIDEISSHHELTNEQKDEIMAQAMEREEVFAGMSGAAYSIVLAQVPFLPLEDNGDEILTAFCQLSEGVNMDSSDGIPTKFVIVMIGRPDQAAHHANIGVVLNSLMTDEEFHNIAYMAETREDVVMAYDEFIQKSAIEVKSSDGDEKPKKRMMPGQGIVQDIKARFPYFASDFKDGMHPKSISSILFLFFAALTPAIAFGGLMDPLTGNNIGALETILATAICGVGFGLFGGQPLIILGATGPMLVFTALLYELTKSAGLPFMPLYVWTGIWTGVFAIILAVTNASELITKFTRFTDEIFSTLISIIFIYEAIEKSVHPYLEAQHGDAIAHLAADRSLLLALGTVSISMALKGMRKGRYLSGWAREFLADFGLIISVLIMTGLDLILHDVQVEHMVVPSTFAPTNKRASWLLDPSSLPVPYVFLSMGLALLAAILLFLDQNITARLVNKTDNNLKKAPGTYHLDTLVVGILIILCSILGLPWMVASTVPSINHINSLAIKEDFQSPNDPTHRVEHIVHVREQRVTAIAIHLLVGLSLLLVSIMKYIPSPVLYGLFLYMGISSLSDNQFWDRVKLLFMQPALFPKAHYCRQVKKWNIHGFTMIQIISLAALWAIKTTPGVGLLFPLALLFLLVIRWGIGKEWFGKWTLFMENDLKALDAEEGLDFT